MKEKNNKKIKIRSGISGERPNKSPMGIVQSIVRMRVVLKKTVVLPPRQ